MTTREQEILAIIEQQPLISQEELAAKLGISRSAVATHIHNLTRKGYIKGRGYIINEPRFVSVIGGINVDVIGIADKELISSNSNSGKINYYIGGAGRNMALALNKLDVPNYLISIYGEDMYGEMFKNNAILNNMNISCCEQIKTASTSTYLYIEDSKSFLNYGIDDMQILKKMTPEFLNNYIERINNSDYCIFDTNLPQESIEYLYQHVNVPLIVKTVSLDKNNRLINGIENIHTLVTTPREVQEIIKSNEEINYEYEDAVYKLLGKGVENIVLFSPEFGIKYYNLHTKLEIYVPFTSYNTNGASASITSTLTWCLLNYKSRNEALLYAYAAAMIISESHEAINPNFSKYRLEKKKKEIEKYLKEQNQSL